MVSVRQQGKALAIAMVGTPIALSLGVPAGSFLGAAVGWRSSFLVMSATTIVLVAWVMWKVPDFAGQPRGERLSVGHVFRTPGIRPILAWMTAHNILYTYVAPFAARSGLADRVDLLLLAFGIAALAGIWVTGILVDRMLRALVLISLTAFGGVTLLLGVAGDIAPVAVTGIILWGLSFGGAATLLQTASADAAGDGVDIANAMITTVWNTAIAAGGIVGGILLDRWGAGAFPWTMLVLVGAALALVTVSRHHGFKPGARAVA